MTRALLVTLAVCLMLAASPGAVSAMSPVGTWINNTCTLTVTGDVIMNASYDTQVVNWLDFGAADDTITSVAAGETIWLSFTVTNSAGIADTVTLDTTSLLGWRVTLWDSRGASGGLPLAAVQKLAAGETLQFKVAACTDAAAGAITDTVRVRAISQGNPSAGDSAWATISSISLLHHFTIDAPDTVYAGVAFGLTVTARNAANAILAGYNGAVAVTVDTGTVAPVAPVLAGGIWPGPLTISDCLDTDVHLVVSSAGIAETVTIRVVRPRIALDKAGYQGLTDLMRISVWDAGQDTPPGVTNRVLVQVSSSADATGITVALTETGLATGIFTGSVRFTQGLSQPGTIKVDSNGNLTVTYDPDGVGGVAAVAAQASWIALIIGDLERVRSWPNPFRPYTDREIVIHQLPADPGMVIEIFNTAAQLIRTLRVGEEIAVTPQENVARWDGCSESGTGVASGTYVYVVKSAAGTVVRKLTVIR